MNSLTHELQQRGLVQQCSNLHALRTHLDLGNSANAAPISQPLSFYLGIDPTAASLHCGHLLPILLAKRLALHGHQPLLLVGSGTAKIGDPSGKTELRQMLSKEEIAANAQSIRRQLEKIFIDSPVQPIWLDNADWLDDLNYIEFLRDVGRHFSVNHMLSFESCKQRLERGLSFIEFNYQLLQSYDYLQLFQRHHCLLQIGGDDQWGNIVSGMDLIRRYSFLQQEAREEHALPQALTVPLVMSSSGKKMGKTEQGAIFIDPKQTAPFDFFQYWRNCSDEDVETFLLLFTFLSVEQIHKLCAEGGAALNRAKEVLAYEMSKTIHGQSEAEKSLAAAKAGFHSGASPSIGEGNWADIPGRALAAGRLETGIAVIGLYIEAGLCASRNEVRRLIQGGGASINGVKVSDSEQILRHTDLDEHGQLLLKAGKKRFFRFFVLAKE